MFVICAPHTDTMTMRRVYSYILLDDDGTYDFQNEVTSDTKLSLDEIMMRFNESNIWLVKDVNFIIYDSDIQQCVKLVNEMKNDTKYSNLFDEQARRLQQAKITQHKFEIRVAAETYKV